MPFGNDEQNGLNGSGEGLFARSGFFEVTGPGMYLFLAITVFFLFCIAVYVYRKDVKKGKMEREDKWRESLPDEEWKVSDPWENPE